MKVYYGNIENQTEENTNFRAVLFTGKHCQLVVMSLLPLEEIGKETHEDTDQFIRVESGSGIAVIDNIDYTLDAGSAVVIPAGTQHNIINASNSDKLKLYTLYAPAHHKDGTIHKTKVEADEEE